MTFSESVNPRSKRAVDKVTDLMCGIEGGAQVVQSLLLRQISACGRVDFLYGAEHGLLIVHQVSVSVVVRDIDHSVQGAEIEQRNRCCRPRRPDENFWRMA